MPRLSEMQMSNVDLSGYERVNNVDSKVANISQEMQPSINTMIRCPIPSQTATPDNLRQFYMGGKIPQTRILSL